MPQRRLEPVTLENVRIIFRNFAGAEGRFNAKAMLRDGWNVKYLQPREEDDKPQARLEVSVNYTGNQPPRVIMITSRGKTALDEDMVQLLDWAEIENVDLILNPYAWEVSGKTGVKAYLKAIYVTIREDELEKKYMDVPDSAMSVLAYDEPPALAIHVPSEQVAITRGEPPF
jgi:hypothetical protein